MACGNCGKLFNPATPLNIIDHHPVENLWRKLWKNCGVFTTCGKPMPFSTVFSTTPVEKIKTFYLSTLQPVEKAVEKSFLFLKTPQVFHRARIFVI